MMNMSLKDVLSEFEGKTSFEFYALASAISKLPQNELELFEAKSELLAMSFSEGGYDEWKTYFGPTTTWTKKDTGEIVYMPDWKEITKGDIEYWKKRLSETSNLFLKNRYAGLIWDFEKKICSNEPNYKEVKLVYIQTAISIVEKDLVDHPIVGLNYISMAIERAIGCRNKELSKKAISVLLDYVTKYATDDKPGIWAVPFDLLIKHSSYFSDFESQILKDNQERFERLVQKCHQFGNSTDSYSHLVIDEVKLFAAYYHRTKNKEAICRYLDDALECVRCSFVFRGSMWAHGMLQQMQSLYRKYNLDKQANKLFIDIQALGSKVLGEMTPQNYTIPLDKSRLNEYFEYYLEGSKKEVLKKYIYAYIPWLEKEKERIKRETELTPLASLVHTVFYDWSGMPINHLGGEDNEGQHRLSYGIYRHMLFESFLIDMHISKMEEQKVYNYDEILALFDNSLVIKKEQKEIFQRAIRSYFDGDYMVACHLLIPLFESCVRTLAAYSGIDVLNNNKNEGNVYKPLDTLFEKLKTLDGVSKDVIAYWQNVFTDKYGWNIRNLFCHGLLQSSQFNKELADRLIHTFLTFTRIEIKTL